MRLSVWRSVPTVRARPLRSRDLMWLLVDSGSWRSPKIRSKSGSVPSGMTRSARVRRLPVSRSSVVLLCLIRVVAPMRAGGCEWVVRRFPGGVDGGDVYVAVELGVDAL